jgi:hypothetical protein
MTVAKKNSVEVYDSQKRAEQEARLEELRNKMFFGVRHQGSYDDGLSTEEIKFLRLNNESFVATMTTIDGFRTLSPEQQESFYNEANIETRTTLESDGYLPQTLAESPDEAAEILDSRRATEQQKLFQQSREAEEELARKQQIYPGVEKIDENLFRLVVDPGDGTAAEIFQGSTPAETFQKLIESKKHATRELRRRASQVKVTQELRDMAVDVIEYAPLEQKVTLTPAELFEAHAMLSDPSTAVEGTRRLQLAARTPEDIARANESLLRGRMLEAQSIAKKWMDDNPQFIANDHNIGQLRDLMGGLNWAITPRNMSKAFEALVEQGVLTENFAAEDETLVVPTPARRVITSVPAPSAPAIPQASRPAAVPVRRPLNNTSANGTSSARLRENTGRTSSPAMSATEYASYTAADMRSKYKLDPAFRSRVDAYWAAGGR